MDANPRPTKRPRRAAARGKRDDGSGGTITIPVTQTPTHSPKQNSGRDVRFAYTRKGINEVKDAWEEVAWDREDAFSELLRQWRTDIMSIHGINREKFAVNVETTDRQLDDGKVEIVYRVKTPANPGKPLEYVGHVRFRGSVGGDGTVDIVTRGLTMDFPELTSVKFASSSHPRVNDQARKKIGNPKLEKAILILMDDNEDHLHRVRVMTGHREWNFKFDNKPADYFLARQRDVDSEERVWINERIRILESDTGRPSSEARPGQDTLLAIGEPSDPGRRDKIHDSCGRTQKNRWARVQEQDFRDWTKRALFLYSHSFVAPLRREKSFDNCNWCYTETGDLILDDRFSGRLYKDGLQLCRWEFSATTPNNHELRYAYNLRKDPQRMESDCVVISLEHEAQAIAAIWDSVVKAYGTTACEALSRLLQTKVPPYRDALNIANHLNDATAFALHSFLVSTSAVSGKPLWYISASDFDSQRVRQFVAMQESSGFEIEVLADSYWSLMTKYNLMHTPEEEMQRVPGMKLVNSASRASPAVSTIHAAASHVEPGRTPSPSPAASFATSIERTSAEFFTEPSTEPSAGSLPDSSKDGPSRCPAASSEPSTELLAQAMTGADNVLMQRIQQLERELDSEKQRSSALQTELNERMLTDNSTNRPRADDSHGQLITDPSTDVSAYASHRQTAPSTETGPVEIGGVVPDESPGERVYPVPSGFFPNEVMRLVQACLKLCPQPMSGYYCLPIEGGTGVVVAGFCRFDHDSSLLKIHKDWLSRDRMRQEFGDPEDTTEVDLLCHTLLTLWDDLIKSESANSFVKHDSCAVWARCRSNIRRRLLDYRQVSRHIAAPKTLRDRGQLFVIASSLANSGWAKEDDKVHLSVHYQACPWAQRSYATWRADTRDRHFTDITAAEDADPQGGIVVETRCDPCRFCHGVMMTGATSVPFYAIMFEGLDPRKKYFFVARNLSQPDSLLVILHGLHSPQAEDDHKWCKIMQAMVQTYAQAGHMIQPLFRDPRGLHDATPQHESGSSRLEPSHAPPASPDRAPPALLEFAQRTWGKMVVTQPSGIIAVPGSQPIHDAPQNSLERQKLAQARPYVMSGLRHPSMAPGSPPRLMVSSPRPPSTTFSSQQHTPPPPPLIWTPPILSSTTVSNSPLRPLKTHPPPPPPLSQPLPRPVTTESSFTNDSALDRLESTLSLCRGIYARQKRLS
ncbi:hypothetical protein CONLIGDRAFT_281905 [Coniochaeta ligniaria NRRL 30616]|uniref:Uncharacterized protein n=1 Tax=Coniochaeta ligniaria NRRL 30616 TaxID=1408157 RepID=A0A1J7ISN4_9PEZI|nr:hypothetical protein CONLIGDRAFT_281905 [Coniochaeta ligniaria NRRL 30616]